MSKPPYYSWPISNRGAGIPGSSRKTSYGCDSGFPIYAAFPIDVFLEHDSKSYSGFGDDQTALVPVNCNILIE